MPLKVAIVGSGPSGFYTAESLIKASPDAEIDIIERLPTPYGLIRGGVAPDHAKTKNVARAYEKTARQPNVRYFGNVEVGRDIALADLRKMYDAVVFASGASRDKNLGLPGDDKQGVYGVAAFVGWYNGHPDFADLAPDLDTETAVVIGVGNVAVDVARVLTKTPEEMAATDLVDHAAAAIHACPITAVHMAGRRGPLQARFTNVELRELAHLQNCAPVVDPAQLPDGIPDDVAATLDDRDRRMVEKNLGTLREFSEIDPASKPKHIHIRFFANPVEILGGEHVEGVRFENTRIDENGRAVGTGEFFDIDCGLVIPAIGYYSDPIEGLPMNGGTCANEDGRVEKGLYAVGWIKRGPSGVIGSNKPDGDRAAEQIVEDCGDGGGKPGREALEAALREKNHPWVSFDDWKKIEAAEEANANPGAPRKKFVRIEEMLGVLR